MKTFTVLLLDTCSIKRIAGVCSFVGEDASGSFGIMPGHGRFMTCLDFGLARFRRIDEDWQYLAMPGALVYFADNQLKLSTRRYFLDHDYDRIAEALTRQLLSEEHSLREMKKSLLRLEQEVLKRLWKLTSSD